MRYSAVHWACVCALSALPLWAALGCGPDAQEGEGGSSGAGGAAGNGGTSGSGGDGGASGVGGGVELCFGIQCDDGNDCTADGACNSNTGECEDASLEPIDKACGASGTGVCNDLGECVECNRTTQCPEDGTVCTIAVCTVGQCTNLNVGGSCDFFGSTGVCEDGVCVDGNLCAPYPCQFQGPCIIDSCNAASGICTYSSAPNGTVCTKDGYQGECNAGACDLCAPVHCADNKQCTIDGACNPLTGNCDGSGNLPINTVCNQDGGFVCDGFGSCVQCNSASQCSDANDCTMDTCNSILKLCANTPVPNGTLCGVTESVCIQGTCTHDPLSRKAFSGDRGDLVSGSSYNGIASVWQGFEPWGLSGFYFNFTGSGVDHEIERIMPGFFSIDFTSQYPGNETLLYARYEDQNADDAHTWAIDAQWLPYGTTHHTRQFCSSGGSSVTESLG